MKDTEKVKDLDKENQKQVFTLPEVKSQKITIHNALGSCGSGAVVQGQCNLT